MMMWSRGGLDNELHDRQPARSLTIFLGATQASSNPNRPFQTRFKQEPIPVTIIILFLFYLQISLIVISFFPVVPSAFSPMMGPIYYIMQEKENKSKAVEIYPNPCF
jgi:hypothetical protein